MRPFVGAIVGVVLAVWSPWDGGLLASIAYGAIAGGAGAAANGANLRGVLKGAAIGGVSAAAFYGVAKAIPGSETATTANTIRAGKNLYMSGPNFARLVVAQGAVGGVMSVLQGGKFGHGFASAGIGKLATPGVLSFDNVALESIASGIVGGTVSELTGGKFANGATTGAFLYAFNAASSAIKDAQKRQEYLNGRLAAFKKEFLSDKNISWDMELRAKALTVTYDAKYDGVAVIESNVKSDNFGHITVGPDFFEGGRIPVEVSLQADIDYINNLSDAGYASFVFRHELAHIAPYQIKMLEPYRQGLKTVPANRVDQPWESRATQDSLNWMRAR